MEWISVNTKLPKNGETVLCYAKFMAVKVFETSSNSYIFYDGETYCYCPVGEMPNVTHWMPLPKPPKE